MSSLSTKSEYEIVASEWSTYTAGLYPRSHSLRSSAFVLEKARSMSSLATSPSHSKVSSWRGKSEKYSLASCEVEVPSPL